MGSWAPTGRRSPTARGRPVLPDENPAHARSSGPGTCGGAGFAPSAVPVPRGSGTSTNVRGASVRSTSARWARGQADRDLDAVVERIAVSGGAGDSLLQRAREAGADVFLTADLRHHPATDHLEGGRPHLLCGTHWATEWVGLPPLAARLEAAAG